MFPKGPFKMNVKLKETRIYAAIEIDTVLH